MNHRIYFNAAQSMNNTPDESVDLVVTSPPYPMIEMWDDIMSKQNDRIAEAFYTNAPQKAFEFMHLELDQIWSECYRVLKNGSFLCINIGDATRTIDKVFSLYQNAARIISACERIGFSSLPNILWRKQTNAPNKFMGSGMLPCGAYVTLEHESILIFRKGRKRNYSSYIEKEIRRKSAFFWEERNIWFSDVWDVKGAKQTIIDSPTRERNASFPVEIPYRLINMYSQKGDIVLDPFMGLGTTTIAAIICERNSIGYEIEPLLKPLLMNILGSINIDKINNITYNRYKKHLEFVEERIKSGKDIKYYNDYFGCQVMTRQETDMAFNYLKSLKRVEIPEGYCLEAEYFNESFFCTPPQNSDSLFNKISL